MHEEQPEEQTVAAPLSKTTGVPLLHSLKSTIQALKETKSESPARKGQT